MQKVDRFNYRFFIMKVERDGAVRAGDGALSCIFNVGRCKKGRVLSAVMGRHLGNHSETSCCFYLMPAQLSHPCIVDFKGFGTFKDKSGRTLVFVVRSFNRPSPFSSVLLVVASALPSNPYAHRTPATVLICVSFPAFS